MPQKYDGVDTIFVKNVKLVFNVNTSGHPYVVCKSNHGENTFEDFLSLIQMEPILGEDVAVTAKVVNFLFKGTEFHLIENPESYRSQYETQLKEEEDSFELPPNALTRYGVFDVGEVSPPRMEKGEGSNKDHLVFFVEKGKVPYKATFDFPIDSTHPPYKYELLKHKS